MPSQLPSTTGRCEAGRLHDCLTYLIFNATFEIVIFFWGPRAGCVQFVSAIIIGVFCFKLVQGILEGV